ncbi:MAG: hypothetical protein LBT40_12965 [Deltaproteobacteria bacterium]|jgi:hypothetical protein|nr:hypothetical protein [Deltaproteobacteria bacterium]
MTAVSRPAFSWPAPGPDAGAGPRSAAVPRSAAGQDSGGRAARGPDRPVRLVMPDQASGLVDAGVVSAVRRKAMDTMLSGAAAVIVERAAARVREGAFRAGSGASAPALERAVGLVAARLAAPADLAGAGTGTAAGVWAVTAAGDGDAAPGVSRPPDPADFSGSPDFSGYPDTQDFSGSPDSPDFSGSPDSPDFSGTPDSPDFPGSPELSGSSGPAGTSGRPAPPAGHASGELDSWDAGDLEAARDAWHRWSADGRGGEL